MSENKQSALTDRQAQDLQELMDAPEDVRARMIAFAAGMLAADRVQSEKSA